MDQISDRLTLLSRIEQVNEASFDQLALDVFAYQAAHNPLYARYLSLLGVQPQQVDRLEQIPFLPISLFKSYLIQSGEWAADRVFTSSGTTGSINSSHALRDAHFYRRNARRGFAHFYGDPAQYAVLALLPAYLERSGSSLVFMADDFIQLSESPHSGFFLNDLPALIQRIELCQQAEQPVLLLGVSFALMDLAEQYAPDLSGVIVMETGGMKGRRKEVTRAELHQLLCSSFGVPAIHSEYGMTELLSQGYSKGEGLFYPAPSLRVLTREITDPLSPQAVGKSGGVNLIDLANLDTISFIATDDLGKVYADGSFEIIGRMDASDIRGCNLLVE